MGYIRFWRRIKIFPGIYLNIGKNSISFSFGPPGIKYTKGTSGERLSVGLPGTGIYYVEQNLNGKKTISEDNENQNSDELLNEIKGK